MAFQTVIETHRQYRWFSAITAIALCAFAPPSASGQGPTTVRSSEWSVLSGGAVDLPGGGSGSGFWAAQLRWGYVLTAPHGPRPFRGTLQYAFEAVPAMLLSQNGILYGGGINPLLLQYNFGDTRRALTPFLQLGGGMLFTTRDFPAGTSSFNFTPQGGFGIYFPPDSGDRTTVIGIRFHHISNASRATSNPGHNALYFYAGFSWWR